MNKIQSVFLIALLLGWILMPAAMYSAGVRTAELETTQTRDFPEIDRKRFFDGTFYGEVTDAFTDRNPVKSDLIKANARLNRFLFGDAATQKVVDGKDGWLFIKEALHTPCVDFATLERRIANFQSLQTSLERDGKQVIFTVFPNKATVYPEKLTDAARRFSECTITNRNRLDAALRRSSIDYLNAFDLIIDQKNMSSQQLYPATETHWNEHGSAIFVEHLVYKLAPDLGTNDQVTIGQQELMPDLSRMSGLYQPIQQDIVKFVRDGQQDLNRVLVKNEGPGRDFYHGTTRSIGAPISDKRILLIHDSFTYIFWDQIGQFFSDVFFMHWSALTPESFERYSAEYDVIVFASVEREIYHRLGVHFEDDGELKLRPTK